MTELSRDKERMFYKTLTKDEKKAILSALKEDKPWKVENTLINNVKKKIKNFHLEHQGKRCCYCYSLLLDRDIETDREHIIPKSKYKLLSYNIFNISISCKRCNMSYKKDSMEHIIDPSNLIRSLRDSKNYNIPHPNLDKYTDHMHIVNIQITEPEIEVIFYTWKTEKGENLSKMFALEELCKNNLDRAQGGGCTNDVESTLQLISQSISK